MKEDVVGGYVARMVGMRNAFKILSENLEGKGQLGDLVVLVHEWISLKRILRKLDGGYGLERFSTGQEIMTIL
jgi:hypothetical protein